MLPSRSQLAIPTPDSWNAIPGAGVAAIHWTHWPAATRPTITAAVEATSLIHGTTKWDEWVSTSLRETAQRLPSGAVVDFDRTDSCTWGLIDFNSTDGPSVLLQRFAPEADGDAVLVCSAVVDKRVWPAMAALLRSMLAAARFVTTPSTTV